MELFKKFNALFIIVRPINLAITSAAVFLGGFLAGGAAVSLILPALTAVMTAAGGNIINDYYDIEIDKINRPGRPLAAGTIFPLEAMAYYVMFSFTSIIVANFIGISAVVIVTGVTIGLYYYSKRLKSTVLAGNAAVSFFAGISIIYGALGAGNWESGLIPAGFAFMINLMREILKDIEDIEGDKLAGIVTFPIKAGIPKAVDLLKKFAILLICLTVIPFTSGIYGIEYFIIVMLGVNTLLVLFFRDLSAPEINLRRESNYLKIAMVFGIIAIWAGNL